jgi:hypothetical protein
MSFLIHIFELITENEETPSNIKQSGNAKVTITDSDYFKLKRLLASQGLSGSMGKLTLGGPQYEEDRIVEGQQGDNSDNSGMLGCYYSIPVTYHPDVYFKI